MFERREEREPGRPEVSERREPDASVGREPLTRSARIEDALNRGGSTGQCVGDVDRPSSDPGRAPRSNHRGRRWDDGRSHARHAWSRIDPVRQRSFAPTATARSRRSAAQQVPITSGRPWASERSWRYSPSFLWSSNGGIQANICCFGRHGAWLLCLLPLSEWPVCGWWNTRRSACFSICAGTTGP